MGGDEIIEENETEKSEVRTKHWLVPACRRVRSMGGRLHRRDRDEGCPENAPSSLNNNCIAACARHWSLCPGCKGGCLSSDCYRGQVRMGTERRLLGLFTQEIRLAKYAQNLVVF